MCVGMVSFHKMIIPKKEESCQGILGNSLPFLRDFFHSPKGLSPHTKSLPQALLEDLGEVDTGFFGKVVEVAGNGHVLSNGP